MVLRKWYETMESSLDCLEDHITWNDMITYIKHSACTDFTIHSICTSGGQAFRFTKIGTVSTIYGDSAAGRDLDIFANDTNAYPHIKLLGNDTIDLHAHTSVRFFEDATQIFFFVEMAGESRMAGKAGAGENLNIYANTTDTFPLVHLLGGGELHLHAHTLTKMYEQANERFSFYQHSVDFEADRAIYINDDETYIGHGAGNIGASGTNNTGVGHDSLRSSTGDRNTAVGVEAGRVLAAGADNTLIGYAAGRSLNTGSFNHAIGVEALYSATSGSQNVCIGRKALYDLTSGVRNMAFGHEAGENVAGGIDDTVFIGEKAGQACTQDQIVGIGTRAARYFTGLYGTAIGYKALGAACSGNSATAIGWESLFSNTSGVANTAIGVKSLFDNTTGSYNTAIGSAAGESTAVDIDSCVYIGYDAGSDNATSSRLFINPNSSAFPLIWGDFASDLVKFGDNDAYWFAQILHENGGGQLFLRECTTPTAQAGYVAIYTKADNKLYCQTGDGVEHEVAFV